MTSDDTLEIENNTRSNFQFLKELIIKNQNTTTKKTDE
jgi:hypothetical protein